MRVHDVEQGSLQWLQAKLGIPSASEFHKIFTPKGKLSKQARFYGYRLVAERLLGSPLVDLDNIDAIARGKELEPEAISLYEFCRGIDTVKVGFITTDDGRIGCSPDRLVGDEGLLEAKAPLPQTHLAYMLEGFGTDYHVQRQGQLLVSGRRWLDMLSYCPALPPVIVRYERDEPFIEAMKKALYGFADMLDALTESAKGMGAEVRRLAA